MSERVAMGRLSAVRWLPAAGAALLLGACANVPPSGPSVTVLPGSAKSFDQFRADDAECRQYASSQIGGETPRSAAADSGAASAAVGAGIGAVAGALIGGNSTGAAVGAGIGLLAGSAGGAGAAQASARSLQQRYDMGFQQCMYAKGHRVPVAGRFETNMRSATVPPSSAHTPRPPSASIPPPPPGSPPPPPPGSPPPPPAGVR
jgi:hypothetical protein